MQNDDVVWSTINKNFCSYKVSTATQKFCRNEYNLTGLCSRLVCPIANSQYATVREDKGIIYLYLKTAERAAFPNKTWEKIKLSRNLNKAIRQIDENLLFWRGFMKSKCKQRFLKITQYLIRMRDLKLKNKKEIIPIQSKVERRTRRKEQKALGVAKFNKVTEKALLERFKQGVYEDLYNINETAFDNFLDTQEVESEVEEDEEEETPIKMRNTGDEFVPADSDDEEIEDDDEDAMSVDSESGQREEVDVDSDFETDESDIEDIPVLNLQKSKKGKELPQTSQEKRPRRSKVSIEYEYETEAPEREKLKR